MGRSPFPQNSIMKEKTKKLTAEITRTLEAKLDEMTTDSKKLKKSVGKTAEKLAKKVSKLMDKQNKKAEKEAKKAGKEAGKIAKKTTKKSGRYKKAKADSANAKGTADKETKVARKLELDSQTTARQASSHATETMQDALEKSIANTVDSEVTAILESKPAAKTPAKKAVRATKPKTTTGGTRKRVMGRAPKSPANKPVDPKAGK